MMKEMKNKRILIVDDEPKNLKILRIRLKNEFDLKEATSGEEALEIVKDFQPALVLLDIMMDGMDGYEVTRKIKENPETSSTKIILVSGKAMTEEKLEGYQAGAEDYITKPFNGEELKAKVAVFISLFNYEQELRGLNQSLEAEVRARSEQLLRSERLSFVGMHAGEIVHNLKNPVAIIKGHLSRLEKKGVHLETFQKIDKATNKILDIIKNILSSIGKDFKDDIVSVSLDEIIKEEIEFLSLNSGFKYEVKVELSLEGGSQVKASRSHLSQIFGNLIKNSAEAMKDSKSKIVRVATKDVDGFVSVKISDTGEGISEEDQKKIFEPLFTTKDGKDGRPLGNGLGLPYCQKMVETYGGKLKISSKLGEGTEVEILLPGVKDEKEGKDLQEVRLNQA